MDLSFKSTVLGDVAGILNENGHSFYFKYWVTKISLRRVIKASDAELWIAAAESPQLSDEELEERKLAAYHAEKSESTTGISHLGFIKTVPISDLQRLLCLWFLTYDYGTIALHPGELKRIFDQPEQPQLLKSIAFGQASGVLHEGQLAIARLLLENGYSMAKDTDFFFSLLEKIWKVETRVGNESDAQAVIVPAMQKLAALVLEYGQSPNIMAAFSCVHPHECTPLHIVPPGLAAELIRCKAEVNSKDFEGKSPLDWVLQPPTWSRHWNLARRYEMCCLLVNAGGLMSPSTPAKVWTDALATFEMAGHDTRVLLDKSPSQKYLPPQSAIQSFYGYFSKV
ncbi:hypothetical protein THARTR1_10797 [Trichoderma harzianum]|uniref:Uncharacterized protein n=1 Tax=Trichoderma harzianum TaxID=5544 RepID=A0A2K0TLT2_TRIHA|nr:hypothetical protein THARTR1_10797 [Trichoderma harzianum]